jgi:hypothetical protein
LECVASKKSSKSLSRFEPLVLVRGSAQHPLTHSVGCTGALSTTESVAGEAARAYALAGAFNTKMGGSDAFSPEPSGGSSYTTLFLSLLATTLLVAAAGASLFALAARGELTKRALMARARALKAVLSSLAARALDAHPRKRARAAAAASGACFACWLASVLSPRALVFLLLTVGFAAVAASARLSELRAKGLFRSLSPHTRALLSRTTLLDFMRDDSLAKKIAPYVPFALNMDDAEVELYLRAAPPDVRASLLRPGLAHLLPPGLRALLLGAPRAAAVAREDAELAVITAVEDAALGRVAQTPPQHDEEEGGDEEEEEEAARGVDAAAEQQQLLQSAEPAFFPEAAAAAAAGDDASLVSGTPRSPVDLPSFPSPTPSSPPAPAASLSPSPSPSPLRRRDPFRSPGAVTGAPDTVRGTPHPDRLGASSYAGTPFTTGTPFSPYSPSATAAGGHRGPRIPAHGAAGLDALAARARAAAVAAHSPLEKWSHDVMRAVIRRRLVLQMDAKLGLLGLSQGRLLDLSVLTSGLALLSSSFLSSRAKQGSMMAGLLKRASVAVSILLWVLFFLRRRTDAAKRSLEDAAAGRDGAGMGAGGRRMVRRPAAAAAAEAQPPWGGPSSSPPSGSPLSASSARFEAFDTYRTVDAGSVQRLLTRARHLQEMDGVAGAAAALASPRTAARRPPQASPVVVVAPVPVAQSAALDRRAPERRRLSGVFGPDGGDGGREEARRLPPGGAARGEEEEEVEEDGGREEFAATAAATVPIVLDERDPMSPFGADGVRRRAGRGEGAGETGAGAAAVVEESPPAPPPPTTAGRRPRRHHA